MDEEALARIERIIDEEAERLKDHLDEEAAEHDMTRARLHDTMVRLRGHEETIGRIRSILDRQEYEHSDAGAALGRIRGLLHG